MNAALAHALASGSIIFYEVWQSFEHLQTHSALSHMQRFHEQRMDFLTRDFGIRPVERLSPTSDTR